MMTFDKLNAGDEAVANLGPATATGATLPPAAATGTVGEIAPYVSPDEIPAVLPHPNLSSPLSRGARYLHHFELELISDGKRLWHVLSEEGQAVAAAIFGEQKAEQDAIAATKAGSAGA